MTTDLNTLDAPAVQPEEVVEVFDEDTTSNWDQSTELQQRIRESLEYGYHWLGDMAVAQVSLSLCLSLRSVCVSS